MSGWIDRDAQAMVDRYARDGVSSNLALRVYTTRLLGRDPKLVKTVGNYWPHATTVYDYVHRAMPITAPGTLTPDETYAVVAWMLAENEIIPRDADMNAKTLPAVKMPAAGRFVIDDRSGKTVK